LLCYLNPPDIEYNQNKMTPLDHKETKFLIKNLLKNETHPSSILNKDQTKLTNIRIIQKNLVYVMGIPEELAIKKVRSKINIPN
jgi:hypothetical protein